MSAAAADGDGSDAARSPSHRAIPAACGAGGCAGSAATWPGPTRRVEEQHAAAAGAVRNARDDFERSRRASGPEPISSRWQPGPGAGRRGSVFSEARSAVTASRRAAHPLAAACTSRPVIVGDRRRTRASGAGRPVITEARTPSLAGVAHPPGTRRDPRRSAAGGRRRMAGDTRGATAGSARATRARRSAGAGRGSTPMTGEGTALGATCSFIAVGSGSRATFTARRRRFRRSPGS